LVEKNEKKCWKRGNIGQIFQQKEKEKENLRFIVLMKLKLYSLSIECQLYAIDEFCNVRV